VPGREIRILEVDRKITAHGLVEDRADDLDVLRHVGEVALRLIDARVDHADADAFAGGHEPFAGHVGLNVGHALMKGELERLVLINGDEAQRAQLFF
jgi:hypothetical protein